MTRSMERGREETISQPVTTKTHRWTAVDLGWNAGSNGHQPLLLINVDDHHHHRERRGVKNRLPASRLTFNVGRERISAVVAHGGY